MLSKAKPTKKETKEKELKKIATEKDNKIEIM